MGVINVISWSLVGTSTKDSSISRLDLTPLDLRLLLIDPIQRGILFPKPKSQEIDQNFVDHLKSSLSRTLDFFPPLAGRLAVTTNDNGTRSFSVDCNNAGVEFTHAVAAVYISDILEPKYVPEIVSSLFAQNGFPNYEGVSKPLMALQLTELADGVFISCTANHAVVDGVSFWHFFNSWSEISRGSGNISKLPVFDRADYGGPISLPPLEEDLWRSFVPPPLLDRVFHFSRESVARLKAKANAEAGTNKISSLQAISAHLWRCSTRCRRPSPSGREATARFMMSVSARGRIPLPEGYFGNAAYGGRTAISEAELLQKGLGNAALKINEFVASQTKEWLAGFVADWVKNPKLHGKGSFSFFITGSHRHDVYGNDFGWGKPIAVRSGKAQKFDGMVTVYPEAAGGGGIDAEISLAPEVLQAMEGDAEFVEAFTV